MKEELKPWANNSQLVVVRRCMDRAPEWILASKFFFWAVAASFSNHALAFGKDFRGGVFRLNDHHLRALSLLFSIWLTLVAFAIGMEKVCLAFGDTISAYQS